MKSIFFAAATVRKGHLLVSDELDVLKSVTAQLERVGISDSGVVNDTPPDTESHYRAMIMLPSRILIRDLLPDQLPKSNDIDFDKGWQGLPMSDEQLKVVANRWRYQRR